MDRLRLDLLYGLRRLFETPGATAAVVLTLAAGTGLNAVVFSLVHAALFRPLPYAHAERLVTVRERHPERPLSGVNPASFEEWREEAKAFDATGGYFSYRVNLQVSGQLERGEAQYVFQDTFRTLGVTAAIGRTFEPRDFETAPNPRHPYQAGDVALLSHAYWRRRFGADPNVLGRSIQLFDQSLVIVGVLRPEFRTLWKSVDIHVPANVPTGPLFRQDHSLPIIARLSEGTSLEQARAEMSSIYRRLREDHPESMNGWDIEVLPLRDHLLGDSRRAFVTLLAGAGLIVMMTTINVAGLLLARGSTRRREVAIRSALGATGQTIARQILTENLLLITAGTLVALVTAAVALGSWNGVETAFGTEPSFALDPRLDLTVLGVSLAVTALAGLLCGLLPALRVSRLPPAGSAVLGGSSTPPDRPQRFSASLIVVQVGLATLLLTTFGLLLESYWRLTHVELGMVPEGLITMDLTDELYPHRERVMEELGSIPGVTAVELTSVLPFRERVPNIPIVLEGRDGPRDQFSAYVYTVSTRFLLSTGMRVLEGRPFSSNDRKTSPWVVLVNQTMARAYWPNESAIGRRLRIPGSEEGQFSPVGDEQNWATVIGVVDDVRGADPTVPPRRVVYIHNEQRVLGGLSIVVLRTTGDPFEIVAVARERLENISARLVVGSVRTMDEVVDASLSEPRARAMFFGLYALLATVLAAGGLHGLLTHNVQRRTKEIGIRTAMGARPRQILALVLGQGMRLTLLGIAIGLPLTLGAARLVASLLFGVTAVSPLTFSAVAALLLSAALVACYVPARSATRVSPTLALRSE